MSKEVNRREFLKVSAIAGLTLSMVPDVIWAEEPKPLRLLKPKPTASGKLVGVEPIDPLVMEDHSDSFLAWREAKIQNRIIVHIDSHIDIEWISDPDLKRISAAQTKEKLSELQLDPLHPEERRFKPLTIMNYLYPTMKEKMAKELYWVLPDSFMGGGSVLNRFKEHLLETVDQLSIDMLNSFKLRKGVIKGQIFGIPFTVCKLSDLPSFRETIVLDIDVDYFDPPNVRERIASPTLWPDDLISLLRKRKISADLVSVCYSVRGGYLLLEHKFLGDDLAQMLKDPKGNDRVMTRRMKQRRAGVQDYAQGKYPEALREFQSALENNPADPSLHYWLSRIYRQMGKREEASAASARASSLDRFYGNPLLYDADYYLNKHIFDKALASYEEILRREPNDLKAILGAGVASSKQGKREKALAYYKKCIDRSPQYFLPYFDIAVLYTEQKKFNLAEEHFRNCVKLNPYFGKAWNDLALLYFGQGEKEKAMEPFQKTVALNPCYKRAQNNIGILYAGQGKIDEAILHFRNATQIDSQYGAAYRNLARIHFLQGNLKEALAASERALKLDPNNAQMIQLRDEIRRNMKNP